MKALIHLIGSVAERGGTSSCGIWQAANMTGDLDAVTCRTCQQTRHFMLLRRDPSQQSPKLAAYRKPRIVSRTVLSFPGDPDRELH